MSTPSMNRPINPHLAYAQALLAATTGDLTPRTAAARNAPRCNHINSRGYRCGSPALRGKPHCYAHDRIRHHRFEQGFPALDDANSIQVAVNQVLDGLRRGKIDRLTAQTYFAGLRVAAMLAPHVLNSDPDRVVLEDPDAVTPAEPAKRPERKPPANGHARGTPLPAIAASAAAD